MPHHLRSAGDHPQPPADRARWNPQPRPDDPMPAPAALATTAAQISSAP
ncbi:hypothetical protein BZL30_7610 [Mycobacterium kansasii]|uniref:Uncharacterized protein n=1 Tax=Mycobacterium kansasii TaxID=1768 RepID=A0A1V3WL47_MYCKA|nr:hypothetical protein BZL30_7610 [Mycobacterium kansasii]